MSNTTNWADVIKKEARGLSDFDLGEVQEVSNGLILTQKGIVNKEIYSFPISVVESFDGNVLRLAGSIIFFYSLTFTTTYIMLKINSQ